jgi:hypothetical protein
MMDIFEAMEQFKREHPEYDQAKDIIKAAQEAMEAYQRHLDSQKPKYWTCTSGSTSGPLWRVCSNCSGVRWFNGMACPTCQGKGGWFI